MMIVYLPVFIIITYKMFRECAAWPWKDSTSVVLCAYMPVPAFLSAAPIALLTVAFLFSIRANQTKIKSHRISALIVVISAFIYLSVAAVDLISIYRQSDAAVSRLLKRDQPGCITVECVQGYILYIPRWVAREAIID